MGNTENLGYNECFEIAKAGVVLQVVVKEDCILAVNEEEHGYDIDRSSILKINKNYEVYIPKDTKVSIHFRLYKSKNTGKLAVDPYFYDKSHLGAKNEVVSLMLEYLNAEYDEAEFKKKMFIGKNIGKYYDSHCGRFFIPIDTISSVESNCLIGLMQDGWILTVSGDGNESIYVLFDPKDLFFTEETLSYSSIKKIESKGLYVCRPLKVCLTWLKIKFGEYDMNVERSFPISHYSGDFGQVIDIILREGQYFNSQVNNWGIALRLVGNNFEFIESHDLGA